MYLLKLYHVDDGARPVAARMLADGRISVGRDAQSDWVIPDADRKVSRTHFELSLASDTLAVTPRGANGVFGATGELPGGVEHPLRTGDRISFGDYRLEVALAPTSADIGGDRTLVAAPFGDDLDIASTWEDGDEATAPAPGGDTLLDAFCRGADLDVSAFSGADPMLVIERAGEMYRQMVIGLTDLLGARSIARTDHRLERTTIGAAANNPFKWAPSRRLACDLLLREDPGFQSGPEAVRASVADVKKHMLASLAGFRAVNETLLDATRPDTIEARMQREKSMLQGLAAACWSELRRVHQELDASPDGGGPSLLERTFSDAYEAQLRDLEDRHEQKPH